MPDEKPKLFREKSLEAIQSPEQMDNYLKVTGVGIWLVLAAVTALLIGAILWGIFGSINTSCEVAVVSTSGQYYCVAPYDELEAVIESGAVTVDGKSYALSSGISEALTVTESMDVHMRLAGGYEIGDIVAAIYMTGGPEEGVYTGTVVTERLKPISLLLQ